MEVPALAACGVSFLVCVFARTRVDCQMSVFSCIVCGTWPSPDALQRPHRHRGPPEQRGARVRPDPPALRLLSLGACWFPLSLVIGRFLLPHRTSVMRRKGRQGKKHRKKIRIFQSDSVQRHLAPILKALLDTRLISEPLGCGCGDRWELRGTASSPPRG